MMLAKLLTPDCFPAIGTRTGGGDVKDYFVIDQRLFELEPRSGELSPGETIILRLSYSYNCLDFGGDHVVPITMKLDKGKQLKLWLRGRTLPRGYGRLFLPSPLLTSLKPIRIGHEAPPTQMVQVSLYFLLLLSWKFGSVYVSNTSFHLPLVYIVQPFFFYCFLLLFLHFTFSFPNLGD